MEAYLDNAATTCASPEVCDVMMEALNINYGNPSSKHMKGMDAERYIRVAEETIAATMKVKAKNIVFTSGGTESNNMALIGCALANIRSGKHIIASGFEHASVYNPLLSLKNMGFRIDFAPVDEMGHIVLPKLLDMISEDTIIVSIMYVNNEVGAVQNIADISGQIKAKKSDIIFHVDAIQAYGKYYIYPKREGIDLLSVSGHKLHGPKGSGFLYIGDDIKLKPIIFGGGQQRDRRSGTENVPAIAGLGVAVKQIYENHDEKLEKLYGLKEHFVRKILSLTEKERDICHINAVFPKESAEEAFRAENKKQVSKRSGSHIQSPEISATELAEYIRKTAPHIVNVSFRGIKSEVMLHALEEKGVYVSSGSACSSNHPGISSTLKAIGVDKELQDSALRFSFSVNTTIEEIDYATDCIRELIPVLRRFKRR